MRIRDGKNSNSGTGMNIPDPQHWNYELTEQDQGCQKSYRLGTSGKMPDKNVVEVLLNATK